MRLVYGRGEISASLEDESLRLRRALWALLAGNFGAAFAADITTIEPAAATVALSAGQLHLLRCLALHGGRVVPRADLHRQVCAPESDLRARSIDVYVHRLRQRLLAAGVRDLLIHAVRGRGFMLRSEAPAAVAPLRAHRGTADAYLHP